MTRIMDISINKAMGDDESNVPMVSRTHDYNQFHGYPGSCTSRHPLSLPVHLSYPAVVLHGAER